MFKLVSFVLLLLFFKSIACSNSIDDTQLLLSVFYESNDSESKRFIIKELEPVMELLHKHITIHFVPFGRAKSIRKGAKGFKCHNGESECLGNMVQDCAIYNMYQNTDLQKVKYVACEMKHGSSLRGNYSCVINSGINKEDVLKCAASSQGVQLQLSSEYITNLIKPNNIPAIGINQVYNTTIDREARTNLLGTLCSYIRKTYPCAIYYNQMAIDAIFDMEHIGPTSFSEKDTSSIESDSIENDSSE